MKRTRLRKSISRLLAAVMFGMLMLGGQMRPVSAETTNVTDQILFASDYQGGSAYEDRLPAILQKIKDGSVNPDLLVFCGDYADGGVYEDGSDTSQADTAGQIVEIKKAASDRWTDIKYLLLQGNHDWSGFVTDGTLAKDGAHEYEDAIIYAIHEDRFPWWQGGYGTYSDTDQCKATVTKTAQDLKTYLDGLIAAGNRKPVFIATHVPLHWSTRSTDATAWHKDNIYANLLFEVVNKAAEKMDIVFLFGHNHSDGYDNGIGGSAICLGAGDSIRIPNGTNGTSNYTTEKLNFTYMNAGYAGKVSSNLSPGTASASLVTVTADEIRISRYTAEGLYTAGSKVIKRNASAPTEPAAEKITYQQVTDLAAINAQDTYALAAWRFFGGTDVETFNGYLLHSENNGSLRAPTTDRYATITYADNRGVIPDTALWRIVKSDAGYAVQNVGTGLYLGGTADSFSLSGTAPVPYGIVSGMSNGYQNYALSLDSKSIRYSSSKNTFSLGGGAGATEVTKQNACNFTIYRVVKPVDKKVKLDIRSAGSFTVRDPVSFIVSLANMKHLMTASFVFEADGAMLESTGVEAMNTFVAMNDGSGEIKWTQIPETTRWQGEVTLMYLTDPENGLTSEMERDVLKLLFMAKSAGTATLKLTGAKLSGLDDTGNVAYFEWESLHTEATVEIAKYYSPYDLDKNEAVDQLDLTLAQRSYQARQGEAGWETAGKADVNLDGVVDMLDLILIFNSYTK